MNTILLFLGGLGMQEMLLIGLVILIFFGARKIPEFMKGLGKGVREFKEGIREVRKDAESSPGSAPTTSTTSTTSTTDANANADERRD